MNILLPLVTLDSVTTFLRDEGFKAVDAERLGKCLDGPSSQLEELKRNNMNDFISLLRDIIQCWLKNNFNPSWNSLAVALDKCGYRLMADKIRQPGKWVQYIINCKHGQGFIRVMGSPNSPLSHAHAHDMLPH